MKNVIQILLKKNVFIFQTILNFCKDTIKKIKKYKENLKKLT